MWRGWGGRDSGKLSAVGDRGGGGGGVRRTSLLPSGAPFASPLPPARSSCPPPLLKPSSLSSTHRILGPSPPRPASTRQPQSGCSSRLPAAPSRWAQAPRLRRGLSRRRRRRRSSRAARRRPPPAPSRCDGLRNRKFPRPTPHALSALTTSAPEISPPLLQCTARLAGLPAAAVLTAGQREQLRSAVANYLSVPLSAVAVPVPTTGSSSGGGTAVRFVVSGDGFAITAAAVALGRIAGHPEAAALFATALHSAGLAAVTAVSAVALTYDMRCAAAGDGGGGSGGPSVMVVAVAVPVGVGGGIACAAALICARRYR